MDKYTKSKADDYNLDNFVEANLKVIVKQIKKDISGLKAIILMGGYGRGEGAVDIFEGKPRLINDFDIYVITEKQLQDDFIEEVALRCSKLIGKGGIAHPEGFEQRYDFDKFFHVDIRCLTEKNLPKLPPTVRYFEMRTSSTVLYGKKNILKKFPKIAPYEIPKPEALRLIMNRMMLLLMSFSPKFVTKKDYMSDAEKGIMTYYIAKSYLTIAEALLIFSVDFESTYAGRSVVFSKIYKEKFPVLEKKFPHLADKVKFFTEYKAAPDPTHIKTIEEWFECREVIVEVFKYCLERFLGTDIPDNWSDVVKLLKKELPDAYFEPYARYYLQKMKLDNFVFRKLTIKCGQLYMNYKYFNKLYSEMGSIYWRALCFMDHGVRILYTTPLILCSINKDGSADKTMIREAMRELRTSYPVKQTDDWEQAKTNYLKTYRLYYLQRFV